MPANSAAITSPMRAGEPVVISTNHGRAMAAISDPVVETTSATNSAVSGRATFGGSLTAVGVYGAPPASQPALPAREWSHGLVGDQPGLHVGQGLADDLDRPVDLRCRQRERRG